MGARTDRSTLQPGMVLHEKPQYWTSYSDMMAGLLMVFMLFLTLILLDYRTMLEAKQSEIDRLLGVKAQIIQALDREFGDSKLDIEIDPQTGAIRFKGGVFFELDSTEISDTGRSYLEEFIPKYMAIILSPRFRPYVAQIIVEGHTDQSGTYLYNLELSQRRAFAVVREILDPDFPEFPEKQLLQTAITANGRSYSQPLQEDGRIDWDRSRRVEFQFRLKDDELIQQVKDLLGQEQ